MMERQHEKEWPIERTRDLIRRVKAQRGLYDKTSKIFKNVATRDLIWGRIGAVLVPPCSAEDVKRKFKSLRDNYQKAKKKEAASISSDSESITQPYVCQYEYYNDLDFLKQYIQPRKTRRNVNRPQSPEEMDDDMKDFEPSTVITLDELKGGLQTAQFKALQTLSEPICGEVQSTSESIPVNKTVNDSSSRNSTVSTPPSSPSHSSCSASPVTRGKAVSSMLQLRTQRSDKNKRQREEADESDIAKLAKTAENVAQVIMAHREKGNKKSKESDESDSCSSMIQFAINQVAADKKLQCVIDVLRVIEAYRKGKGVAVAEIG